MQHIWDTGDIPTEMQWTILALLPKDGGRAYRGIGLVEHLQKVLDIICDTRIKSAVVFHDVLHGFRARRGTGTAIIEIKLAMELARIEQAPLHINYLDLTKAHDTVDRERALDMFEECGMGPKMIRLTENFWKDQKVVAKQSGFFGPAFDAEQGETQGCSAAPTRFNIIIDKVVRHWLTLVVNDDGMATSNGFGMMVNERLAMFCADDGLTASRDPVWLQNASDVLVHLFRRMGLVANVSKTKMMTCYPGSIHSKMPPEAHEQRVMGQEAPQPHQLPRV